MFAISNGKLSEIVFLLRRRCLAIPEVTWFTKKEAEFMFFDSQVELEVIFVLTKTTCTAANLLSISIILSFALDSSGS